MSRYCRGSAILLLALLSVAGCKDDRSRRPPVIATPALSAAQLADRHYALGEFTEAARAYEEALNEGTGEAPRGALVFRLAMSYMSLEPGLEGQKRALQLLRRELPQPAPASQDVQASLLLDLLESLERLRASLGNSEREARRLAGELEKLRDIDLKRRPPGAWR